MIQKITYIAIMLMLLTGIANAQGQPVTVVSGKYTSEKRASQLKTFTVSKGDVIEFNITTLHKKRGLNIWVKQNPGGMLVLDFEELKSSTKQIVAPADAIYQVFFGGTKLDFNIEIIKHTNNPNGPGRGDIVYVRIPDTLHASSYVNTPIGENYTLSPYTEKVLLSTKQQPEQIISRDFITGVDYLEVEIPGNTKDDYREQKLLSYSVTLTCGELSMYNAMMGVVDAGVDLALDKISGKVKDKMKTKKGTPEHQYDFTKKDLDEESNKLETITEIVTIADSAAIELAPGSNESKMLSTTAFVLDGGVQEIVLEKAMDAAGVPKNIQAIYGKVQDFPDVGGIVKDNVHKLIPKVKGSAHMVINEPRLVTHTYPVIPQKEFWIQSAMNYGKNGGGCFDVPGEPTAGQKGQNIKIWNIAGGADRKFKIVPSTKYQGHYEIHSAQTGNVVLDVSNGETNKKGANIQLWEKNNSNAQQFVLKHLGGGKFKIMTISDFVVCLDARKNANGTNVHLWEGHNGAWTEWYLVDPVTSKAFVPTENKPYRVWENITVFNQKGGVVTKEIKVDTTAGKSKKIYIAIGKQGIEAKAKLLVEANYEITNYTDVVKYKRTTQEVNTKDFWTAYKVNYDYQIMFKNQVRNGWKIIPKGEYYSSMRPKSEEVKSGDQKQKMRLMKYDFLTKKK